MNVRAQPRYLSDEFIHLALPFGKIRRDNSRRILAYSDSVKSVRQFVEHFNDAGCLDSIKNRQRDLYMDEIRFPLDNILVGRHNMEKLVLRANDRMQSEGVELLAIVRNERDYSNSPKGKRRYLCSKSAGTFDEGRRIDVRPVLVCEDPVATLVDEMNEWKLSTFLVAARPFIHADFNRTDQSIQIYLNLSSIDQIAPISPDHWRAPRIKNMFSPQENFRF